MGDLPCYEIQAVRYATRGGTRKEHFIGGDPHEAPMPMDYFVWFIRGEGRTVVVDTGFTAEMAERRKRQFLASPLELLARCGVQPQEVLDVVITHLHYDHAGNLGGFPRATFHLQEREMAFATGRYMCHHAQRHSYEADDVCEMVRLLYGDRLRFHDGVTELYPGISLHRIGGHTDGLMSVRVHTARGWVVLASDVSHFYENVNTDRPFTLAFHVGEMLEGFNTLRRLADSADHIVPGHDPQVFVRYPSAGVDGVAVRVDLPPLRPLQYAG
ncbi:N-acyl homoserine lactonase family protein [Xylophilus sp. GOD-11R]|uniref:N-acyl homoserine lactonase family protein n=1 Tax=Xylophilus sp. GOD-11R TaxID=3089814 RepID=UPI00298D54FA|nr:N-acyl homoserine lactonase family protein [Xylophilus sp. GOD-11R]WPB55508.1 N-acyl homoserine lactonase family protein [Xylophilus sp. GOD-11R]